MKLVTGLHGLATVETVDVLIEAGAEELFAGFVPEEWSRRFGWELSPNRRYRRENQLESLDGLALLLDRIHAAGKRLSLAVNEHEYSPPLWSAVLDLVDVVADAGVDGLIVAHPVSCRELRGRYPDLEIHVSGDAGVMNVEGLRLFAGAGASRVIFSRHLGLERMAPLVAAATALGLETEAFVMGEPCEYDGARCFSGHGYGYGKDFCQCHQRKVRRPRGGGAARPLPPPLGDVRVRDPGILSLGRCGLCALPRLRKMGVTHLKVPGRASSVAGALRRVNEVLRKGDFDPPPQGLLGAPELCRSGLFCYYPEAREGVE